MDLNKLNGLITNLKVKLGEKTKIKTSFDLEDLEVTGAWITLEIDLESFNKSKKGNEWKKILSLIQWFLKRYPMFSLVSIESKSYLTLEFELRVGW